MEDNPETGGVSSPSAPDAALGRMIRDGLNSWHPRVGPDWVGLMSRVAGNGPSPWLTYSLASAALIVILVTAFVLGSYFEIGALAPQPVSTHLP